jgi:hypothetical protein
MVVKNLFDTAVRKDIIDRINRLEATKQPLWGKMNAAQMCAHCQMPMGVAVGKHKLSTTFIFKLLGPLFKSVIYNDKPFKRNLQTHKSFVMTGSEREFEVEKQKLIAMVNDFTEANMVNEPHPIFGRMTKEQWSRGTWKHLDHHLQQFGV